MDTLELPPSSSDPRAGGQRVVLVVAWYAADPRRSGEVVTLPFGRDGAPVVLGRGGAGRNRAKLWQQRPGENILRPPLDDPFLSREQLRISPIDGGGLLVENSGQLAIKVRGQKLDRIEVGVGDLFAVDRRLLLWCTRRPIAFPGTRARLHPFGEPDADGFVGESFAAWSLRDIISTMAPRHRHALVRGESGTGKEIVAQALHRGSRRYGNDLVARNAATLPEALVAAELFGNARNYPNPGMAERIGLVGRADGSTLFLDEIAELPEEAQAQLLRVLDSGEYQRLGESTTRASDFRLVGATNRELRRLKHDLLARLPLRVEVPPLRERREDIGMLIRHLLRRMAMEDPDLADAFLDEGPDGEPGEPRVSLGLVDALMQHDLPTNVRQLEAALWEAVLAQTGSRLRINAGVKKVLSGHVTRPEAKVQPDEVTPERLQAAMQKHGGVLEKVWRELGLSSRYVLRRLMRKYEGEGWTFGAD